MLRSRLFQLLWLLLSIAVIAADQFSKLWVTEALEFHEVIPLLPFLNLTYTHNTGAAFGFLGNVGGLQQWLFAVVAVGITGLMTFWLYRLPSSDRLSACAFALIIGGALGNLWDRLLLGYVIDFIDFYVGNWHFATFNIADSAICIGAAILVFTTFRK